MSYVIIGCYKIKVTLAFHTYVAVKTIASNPDTTGTDVVTFFDSLRNLVNHCKYNVNSTKDEENKEFQPLLLRLEIISHQSLESTLCSDVR